MSNTKLKKHRPADKSKIAFFPEYLLKSRFPIACSIVLATRYCSMAERGVFVTHGVVQPPSSRIASNPMTAGNRRFIEQYSPECFACVIRTASTVNSGITFLTITPKPLFFNRSAMEFPEKPSEPESGR